MDKKSIIGIVLIFAILVVFSIINQPSKEEIEAAKHRKDSIAQIEMEKAMLRQQQEEQQRKDTPGLPQQILLNQVKICN